MASQPLIATNGSAGVKCHMFFLTILLRKLKLQSCYLLTRILCFSYVIIHMSAAYGSSRNCSLRIEGNNYVNIWPQSRFVEISRMSCDVLNILLISAMIP